MKQKNTSLPPRFSRAEYDHLSTLFRDAMTDGSYYGNREQYWRRHDRIWRKLKIQLQWLNNQHRDTETSR